MSFQIILVVHVLLALGMVGLILIQHGKGAGAGAGFGSGAAGTVFGARGANTFLYKLTSAIALGFFITSISLAYLATSEGNTSDTGQSIMTQPLVDETPEPESSDVPSS